MNGRPVTLARRELLGSAAAMGAAALLAARLAGAADAALPRRFIDTNVSLFQWPFRRLPLDEPRKLVEKLRSLGFAAAWAGSFEGLLHRDVAGVNARLAAACAEFDELTPIGTVNPELPNWELDLRQCVERHHMPGVRLHPNHHGYKLDDPRFLALLEAATAAGVFVQLAASMEDGRTQHPLVRVADVDLSPLSAALERLDAARVQILNAKLREPLLSRLLAHPGVCLDTARVESTDGVATLLRSLPPGRVLYGSHAPFLIPEAALIRVGESPLQEQELRALLWENAARLRGAA